MEIIRSNAGFGWYANATPEAREAREYAYAHPQVRPRLYLGLNGAREVADFGVRDPGLQVISRFYAPSVHRDQWLNSPYNNVLPEPRWGKDGFSWQGDEVPVNLLLYQGGVARYLDQQWQHLKDCPGNGWITVFNEVGFNQPPEHITQVVIEALAWLDAHPDAGIVFFNWGMGGPNNKQVASGAPVGGGSPEELMYTGWFEPAMRLILDAFRRGRRVGLGYHPYWMGHPMARIYHDASGWHMLRPHEAVPPGVAIWDVNPFTDWTMQALNEHGSDILMRVEQRHALWFEALGYADLINQVPLFATEGTTDSVLDGEQFGGFWPVYGGDVQRFFEDWTILDRAWMMTGANVQGMTFFCLNDNDTLKFQSFNLATVAQAFWDLNVAYELAKVPDEPDEPDEPELPDMILRIRDTVSPYVYAEEGLVQIDDVVLYAGAAYAVFFHGEVLTEADWYYLLVSGDRFAPYDLVYVPVYREGDFENAFTWLEPVWTEGDGPVSETITPNAKVHFDEGSNVRRSMVIDPRTLVGRYAEGDHDLELVEESIVSGNYEWTKIKFVYEGVVIFAYVAVAYANGTGRWVHIIERYEDGPDDDDNLAARVVALEAAAVAADTRIADLEAENASLRQQVAAHKALLAQVSAAWAAWAG